eukprot:m51a1_g4196 putative p-loop containing nucleoside triphosphate hydrolase protein (352) ;mRNA; r:3247-4882
MDAEPAPAPAPAAVSAFDRQRASFEQSTATLPWVEKYRPKELTGLVGHEGILATITKLVDGGKLPHMLFYGPPGSGKTTTILAVARKLFGPSFASMVLELNASDDRGIDVVREQIKEFASSQKLFSTGVKLVVLDECDAMTSAAQAALRRVIEKYTKSTRFCLICNHVNKITPAIQSRCTRLRFAPLQADAVERCVRRVAEAESVKLTDDGVSALVRMGNGDLRRVLNILQSTALAYEEVTRQSVYDCTGHPSPEDMRTAVEVMLSESFNSSVKRIREMQEAKGLALQDMLSEILPFVLAMQVNQVHKMRVVDKISVIEHRLACGCSERLQLGALVSAFQIIREHCADMDT